MSGGKLKKKSPPVLCTIPDNDSCSVGVGMVWDQIYYMYSFFFFFPSLSFRGRHALLPFINVFILTNTCEVGGPNINTYISYHHYILLYIQQFHRVVP